MGDSCSKDLHLDIFLLRCLLGWTLNQHFKEEWLAATAIWWQSMN